MAGVFASAPEEFVRAIPVRRSEYSIFKDRLAGPLRGCLALARVKPGNAVKFGRAGDGNAALISVQFIPGEIAGRRWFGPVWECFQLVKGEKKLKKFVTEQIVPCKRLTCPRVASKPQ